MTYPLQISYNSETDARPYCEVTHTIINNSPAYFVDPPTFTATSGTVGKYKVYLDNAYKDVSGTYTLEIEAKPFVMPGLIAPPTKSLKLELTIKACD